MLDKFNNPVKNYVHFNKIEMLGKGGQGKAYKIQIEVRGPWLDQDLVESSLKKRRR